MSRSMVLAVVFPAALLIGADTRAQQSEAGCPWQQDDVTDEIGASTTQTPRKVLQAIRLVKEGRTYRLAHIYEKETLPLPFGRLFDLSFFPFDFEEDPSQSFNEGFIEASIGQVGTQFDALGHTGHDTFGYYNCIKQEELGPDNLNRLRKLGVETVLPFFTRGVLLDFVHHSDAPKMRVNGETMLVDSYVITMEDVKQVLRNQGVDQPKEGDVALFYTGWDSLFGVENDRFFSAPGPGIEVARWLASQRVALVGADTQAVEALDAGVSVELVQDPNLFGDDIGRIENAVHFILLTQNGIHLLEFMRLQHLAADLHEVHQRRGGKNHRVSPYEFLFTYAPIPIRGLAGSPGQPLAVR